MATPSPGAPDQPGQYLDAEVRGVEHKPIDYEILAHKLRLDRLYFSPCVVDDNKYDPRYTRAVSAFQEVQGLKVDGSVGPITSESLGAIGPLTKEFVLEPRHFEELVQIPSDWRGMSYLRFLGYQSIAEMVAERAHTSRAFLQRLNPGLNWDRVTSGTTIVVPRVTRPWPKFYASRVEIVVPQKVIRVYDEEGKLRAFFNCSIGRNKKVYGGMELRIAAAAEWPNYTFKPELFGLQNVIDETLILPPGPNNLVGRAWVGLDRPGYGIHGTPTPETIGQTESHGCIRLPNWDSLSFYRMARIGAPVYFVDTPSGPVVPVERGAPVERAAVTSSVVTSSVVTTTGVLTTIGPATVGAVPSTSGALTQSSPQTENETRALRGE